jgi:hypothetical protein
MPKTERKLILSSGYKYSRDVKAYCVDCSGTDYPKWQGNNAHGVAVQHARRTGHKVIVETYMHLTYNDR